MVADKKTEKKTTDEGERGNYGGGITAIIVLALIVVGITGFVIWIRNYKH